jgi:hypothetical protein
VEACAGLALLGEPTSDARVATLNLCLPKPALCWRVACENFASHDQALTCAAETVETAHKASANKADHGLGCCDGGRPESRMHAV